MEVIYIARSGKQQKWLMVILKPVHRHALAMFFDNSLSR